MKLNKYIYISALLVAMATTGCTSDFLDINDDPNKPTSAELNKLLSGAQYDVSNTFACGYYIGSSLPSYVSYLSSREVDNFGIGASTSTLGNTWQQGYAYGLKNANAVVKEAEASDNMIYAGIGKLLKVQAFLGIVDLWGDVPFLDFGVEGNYAPRPDKSSDVYNYLLDMIDSALANLKDESSANLLKPSSDDMIYGGSVAKWIKLANSLKLKMLVQSRKSKSEITGWESKLSSLLAEDNFINDGEDFEFKRTSKDNPDERHGAYVDEYLGGQTTYYISPWIYEIMNGLDYNVKTNPFIGIRDPRVPYYWVNQLTDAAPAQNSTDYRDGAFVSIFFASSSIHASNAMRESASMIGIYACGGKYDDGKGGKCDSKVGNGVAPEKMLQAYSIPFLKAELYLAGDATGDAKEALSAGIRRSIKHVNTVTAASDATVPQIAEAAATELVDKVISAYEGADANGKLEIVMTQKWIANFFNPVEAYTDIRRTGYPVLLKKGASSAISPYKNDKEPSYGPVELPLKGVTEYPRAMLYPNHEVSRNPNVTNSGRNIYIPVLFWDK